MTKEKRKFLRIQSEDICRIYKNLRDKGQIDFDITENALRVIDAIVSNINGSNYGEERYKTVEEKAVAYLYFLIKNHPFVDGNKRTAILTFEVLCNFNDLKPNYKDTTLDEIAVDVEKFKTDEHQKYIKKMADFIFE